MIRRLVGVLALGGLSVMALGAQRTQTTQNAVSYQRDVLPILKKNCSSCHSNGAKQGDFSLDSREAILTGGKTHPVVRPGKGAQSYLIELVSKGVMPPPQGAHLKASEVETLRRWIDAGLPFDGAAENEDAAWTPPLALQPVRVPAGAGNPIDRLLAPYFTARKVQPGPVVGDRVFVRRAYLDLIGLLPSSKQANAFLQDTRPDKRERLVASLLGDTKNYTEHWLTFWNDALRNDYVGTGYIDGGRSQITNWLYASLESNKPYDQFVRELVAPISPESEGFIKGIVWRGVVNASQRPPLQAAQNIGQVFLGVNLKCASCHDSFTSNWKLRDAYGLAAVFSDTPLELVRCDKPTGTLASASFLWPELGGVDGSAPLATRRSQVAAALTSPANGRFARTIVNRLWTKLMGRGLIEPNDELDHKPWNPALLDWLASDFVAHGYDLKHTLAQIATSRAYQLPSQGLAKEKPSSYVFTGPAVKRLSAEQLADAISTLTETWPTPVETLRINKGAVSVPKRTGKLLFDSGLLRAGAKKVEVALGGSEVLALVATDGNGNGNHDWADWIEPRFVFADGRELSVRELTPLSATTGFGTIQTDKNIVGKALRLDNQSYSRGIGTHANSVILYAIPRGATNFRALVGPDQGAVEEAPSEVSVRFAVVEASRALTQARAALTTADAFTRALGRPNREQTVTQRQSVATTLQALELTNGPLLSARLKTGAAIWIRHASNGEDVLSGLYQTALSRPPTATERATIRQAVGTKLTPEALEDILWALLMSPEFQLY
jgi:mono/diheme cytochrome c family protein